MKSATKDNKTQAQLQAGILNCLWYYHYFEHPLKTEEIFRYLEVSTTQNQLEASLNSLLEHRKIEYRYGYWSLPGAIHFCRQRKKNHLTNKMHLFKAQRMAKIIARFPFVKAVGITGSLSKLGSSPKDDIDFFIVTKERRLWLCKFLLILYKKTILLNSHRNFCLNLFRSNDNLSFKNQNLYIATEIATVIPLIGKDVFIRFFDENRWVRAYFPNWKAEEKLDELIMNETEIRFKERILSQPFFDGLENWARRQFAKHIIKKRNEGSGVYSISVDEAATFPDNPQNKILHYVSQNPFKQLN